MHLNRLAVCVCTGKVVHSMVAHLDAVTCLTTDPKGTYLISGSEYHSALLSPNAAEHLCIVCRPRSICRILFHCTLQRSLPLIMLLSLFAPARCPLQAMTARCACGCWTTGRVCRRSRPTGRSTTRPSMTWPSTLPSPSLPAPAQMHLPRSLSDSTVVILVRWRYYLLSSACTQ